MTKFNELELTSKNVEPLGSKLYIAGDAAFKPKDVVKLKMTSQLNGSATVTTVDGELLYQINSSTWKKQSTIANKDGEEFAHSKQKYTAINKVKTTVYRTTPAFEGQATTDLLYPFADVISTQKFNTAHAVYSIYSSNNSAFPYYQARRVPAMKFAAVVMTGDDTPVCKIKQVDMFGKQFEVEIVPGVDVAAALIVGFAVVPGGQGTAGALVGAGVI